ncbi:hypothetical protein PLG01_00248 [Streptococcus mutans PKUSS-LG01]|nr:hypothetical protein PLG01_00248 [Streptococcus mutans PKUSS-LG01]
MIFECDHSTKARPVANKSQDSKKIILRVFSSFIIILVYSNH